MKAKWYLSAFILIAILFGFNKQNSLVPNQEIIVKFSSDDVTADAVSHTVASVKKALHHIGIDEVQVHELEDGVLKIAYYSTVNAAHVKSIFDDNSHLELGYIAFNKETDSKIPADQKQVQNYSLDVFEIQQQTGNALDFDGKCTLDLKNEYDRFSNPNVYILSTAIDIRETNSAVKVAYKVRRKIVVAIENMAYSIPEVRAGPLV